jgi:hypothetical protein
MLPGSNLKCERRKQLQMWQIMIPMISPVRTGLVWGTRPQTNIVGLDCVGQDQSEQNTIYQFIVVQ